MANLKTRTNVFFWICWLANAINGSPWNWDGLLTIQLDPKAAKVPKEGYEMLKSGWWFSQRTDHFKKRWKSTLHIFTFDSIPQFYYNQIPITLFRKAATKCFNYTKSWLTKQELMSLQHFSSSLSLQMLIKHLIPGKASLSFSPFLSHMGWNWISFVLNLHLSAK